MMSDGNPGESTDRWSARASAEYHAAWDGLGGRTAPHDDHRDNRRATRGRRSSTPTVPHTPVTTVHITGPGGIVQLDAGRIEFNPDGTVASISGPHPQLQGPDLLLRSAALTRPAKSAHPELRIAAAAHPPILCTVGNWRGGVAWR